MIGIHGERRLVIELADAKEYFQKIELNPPSSLLRTTGSGMSKSEWLHTEQNSPSFIFSMDNGYVQWGN